MSDHSKEFELSVGTYTPNNLAIVSGQGAMVRDDNGKEYIDCIGGHGVCNVGHGNEAVSKAICEAWQNFAFETSRHPHILRERLFERLAEKMPKGINKFFLSNSGTEAVEAALKFARAATGKTKILAAKLKIGKTRQGRAAFAEIVTSEENGMLSMMPSFMQKIVKADGGALQKFVAGMFAKNK